MHTSRCTWALFDADGTLFDFERAELAALERTLAQFGTEPRPEYLAIYRGITGLR